MGIQQHADFLDRNWNAEPAEDVVTRYLRHNGYGVYRGPFRQAPTAAEHLDYSDGGDLIVYQTFHPQRRAEVRQRLDIAFTCADDYGVWRGDEWIDYPTIRIGKVEAVERAAADWRMWRWYIVNQAMTHAAVIDHHKTWKSWVKCQRRPHNTGNWEWGWEIDKTLVDYISLEVTRWPSQPPTN